MIPEVPETRSPRNLRGYWEYENIFTLLQKLIDEKRLEFPSKNSKSFVVEIYHHIN